MGEPSTIGPGLGAFIAFFFLAVALWLLMRNMTARMRRMAYRERDRIAALEAQQAAASASPDDRQAPDRAPSTDGEGGSTNGSDRPD
ncbi:MAG: hypothetical protein WCG47_17120 [Dermatophilaceae bacterium]